MLWVNLIMDTLGALALATEPPSADILKRQPYAKHNAIITPVMWRNVIGHGVYQIIVIGLFIFWGPGWLCQVYWTECSKWSEDGKVCDMYNPFYNEVLYDNKISLKYWENKAKTV